MELPLDSEYRLNYIEVRNFMGVRAMRMEPGDGVTLIVGQNGQGKTSLIKAISTALENKRLAPGKPVRDGEDKAEITVDIGKYIVKRTFTQSGDMKLDVKSKDGLIVPAAQDVLNEILGAVSFDPFEFAQKPAADQSKMLATVLNIDFTDLNSQYATAYSERTAANKERDRIQAEVDAKRRAVSGLKASDFKTRVVIDDVLKEQKAAQEYHDTHRKTVSDVASYDRQIAEYNGIIKDFEDRLEDARKGLAQVQKNRDTLQAVLDLPGELPDLSKFDDQIRNAGTHNETVAKFNALKVQEAELDTAIDKAETLDKKVKQVLTDKEKLLKSTEMPVEGMKLDENGIYVNGIPLKQCSSAEQLKVAVGLAMKLNPKLRVLRIMNGSLLDKASHKVIDDMAAANGFQVFIEIVGDSATGTSILIEDGRIVSE
jgi:DNA repair exonuclease SbcCD ATPase subunit